MGVCACACVGVCVSARWWAEVTECYPKIIISKSCDDDSGDKKECDSYSWHCWLAIFVYGHISVSIQCKYSATQNYVNMFKYVIF